MLFISKEKNTNCLVNRRSCVQRFIFSRHLPQRGQALPLHHKGLVSFCVDGEGLYCAATGSTSKSKYAQCIKTFRMCIFINCPAMFLKTQIAKNLGKVILIIPVKICRKEYLHNVVYISRPISHRTTGLLPVDRPVTTDPLYLLSWF
jgi:hypothetical protein